MPDVRSYRPEPDCRECRLGSLTVPCSSEDVRRLLSVDSESAPTPVKPYRNSVVLGEGPVPCPVMLIGEAPGYHEDREGKPFRPQAPAGRVLQQCLEEVGLCRFLPERCSRHGGYVLFGRDSSGSIVNITCSPVYITNVVKCRPLDNKLDKFPDAVEVCRERFLFPEVKVVKPKVIVALGATAAVYWFGSARNASRVLADGTTVIHAPHPSSIARGNVDGRARLLYALREAKEIGYHR